MKPTHEIIQIAGTGANIIIDAAAKPTHEIIQIVGSIGMKDSHITIKNANLKPTHELIQIAYLYSKNITFDLS